MQDSAVFNSPAFAELYNLQQQANAQLQATNPLLFSGGSTGSGGSIASGNPNPFRTPYGFQRPSDAHLQNPEVTPSSPFHPLCLKRFKFV